jgi:hypothetical protein
MPFRSITRLLLVARSVCKYLLLWKLSISGAVACRNVVCTSVCSCACSGRVTLHVYSLECCHRLHVYGATSDWTNTLCTVDAVERWHV